ncbi:MAG: esterase/lipase family protein [Candidatus Dormibacteria bacterium]
MKTRVVLAASLIAGTFCLGAAVPGWAASRYLPFDVPPEKLAAAMECPGGFHHPEREAVLLVHGTSVTADENWAWNYELALPKVGFDVCTIEMPDYALSDMQVSAEYVVYGIRETALQSHRRIAVIGLSQGADEPRWALKWWPDTRALVEQYISMAGSNHGGAFGDGDCAYSCPPALWQQSTKSRFMAALNLPHETQPGVNYTSIYSLTDDIIEPSVTTPAGRAVAPIDGATNITVQSVCPGRYVGHVQSAWDAAYYAVVLDALTHRGPGRLDRVDRSFCNQRAMPEVNEADAWQRTAAVYADAGIRQSEHYKPTSEPLSADYVTKGTPPPGALIEDAARPAPGSAHTQGQATAAAATVAAGGALPLTATAPAPATGWLAVIALILALGTSARTIYTRTASKRPHKTLNS